MWNSSEARTAIPVNVARRRNTFELLPVKLERIISKIGSGTQRRKSIWKGKEFNFKIIMEPGMVVQACVPILGRLRPEDAIHCQPQRVSEALSNSGRPGSKNEE